MNQATNELLEAHLQHELARFKPRKLRQTIRAEVAALFGWIKTTTLGEVITPEQVLGLIARNVVERPLPDAIVELATAMSRQVLASGHNSETTVADICTRASFDAVVSKVAGMQEARADLIHRLVSSSVYSHQISEVLFTGIKEYLLTENILAQKVPGVSSLIKLGKFAVNKTLQPIEAAVEKAVKTYIEANLGNTIRRSEQSINDYFDEDRVTEMGDALWDAVGQRPLSEFMRVVDGEDMDNFVDIGVAFWLEFRETPYFEAIYTDVVHAIFDRYADTSLRSLATDFGLTVKIATDELTHALAPGVDQALISGFLEQRIRAHLEGFYSSPDAAKLIAAWAKAKPDKPVSPKPKVAPAKRPAAKKAAKGAAPTKGKEPVVAKKRVTRRK